MFSKVAVKKVKNVSMRPFHGVFVFLFLTELKMSLLGRQALENFCSFTKIHVFNTIFWLANVKMHVFIKMKMCVFKM